MKLRSVPLLALALVLSILIAACAEGATPPQAPKTEPKPAAKSPATAPATVASPSPAGSPAAKPGASPAASPSPMASPAASPAAASPAAGPIAVAKPSVAPGELGSPSNPIRMAFVPSSDSQKVLASGEPLARLLEEATGLSFTVSVPTSYAAVIEAMGAERVDVGWLAPFAYVLAQDKFGTEVILSSVRGGSKTYTGQIIVPADSGITDVEQLRGKKFAFVDPSSASGFLYPNALLASRDIDFKTDFSETVFAGGHDKVVIAVYNKQVDGGATFGDSIPGTVTDARTTVQSTLPDVLEKVKVIAQTEPIPNDTVAVREGLPPDIVAAIRDGLLAVAQTEEGKRALRDLYRIDGLAPATDSEYDTVRRAAEVLGLDLEQELAPR